MYTPLYFRRFLRIIMKYYLNYDAMYHRTHRTVEKKDDFYYYPIAMKHNNFSKVVFFFHNFMVPAVPFLIIWIFYLLFI